MLEIPLFVFFGKKPLSFVSFHGSSVMHPHISPSLHILLFRAHVCFQDSNSVVSNSDNMNSVMAMILPVPGRKKRSNFYCSIQAWEWITSLKNEIERFPDCSQYFICNKLLSIRDSLPLAEILTSHNGRTLYRSDCPQKYCANLYV